MFLRCRKYKQSLKRVLSICESCREGDRVIQRTVKYLGVAHTEEEFIALERLGRLELAKLQAKPQQQPAVVAQNACGNALLGTMVEVGRLTEGCYDIFGQMFDRLGLEAILSPKRLQQLKEVVIARIVDPASKLRTSQDLLRRRQKSLSHHQIYRLMDALGEHSSEVEEKIFECTQTFHGDEKIDVLLFDVTTLHFESQQADELRSLGYSKDHKVGEVQVVLALATTPSGLPIGYKLFPGNTAEVKTLVACVREWEAVLPLGQVLVVADRAMMSETNLALMEKVGFRYIVAAKLRSLPAGLREKILNSNDRTTCKLGDESVEVQEFLHKGRRLVVGYSDSRARKDRSDRDRLVERVKSRLGKDHSTGMRKLVTNTGYRKYVIEEAKGCVRFNDRQIAEEARWDGLHGVITNDMDTPAHELLSRYRNLWVIEESFRINKHTLEMRPIYHFKPTRIASHILLCYIAFALSRYVQAQVKNFVGPMSVEQIRAELSCVQTSLLEDSLDGQQYIVPSQMSETASNIYRAFGMRRRKRPHKLAGTSCGGSEM